MLAGEFTEAFREEHRQMRDSLLGLIEAIEGNDAESFRRRIGEMMAQAGPHFHYEQEALYPALAEIHGADYVEQLRAEHDAALEAIEELAALAEAEELGEEESAYGRELVRQLLPHVSDRDGLAMIVEVLPEEKVKSILETREASRRAGKHILELAKERKKSAAPVRKPGKALKRPAAPHAKAGKRKAAAKSPAAKAKAAGGKPRARGAAKQRRRK